MAVETKLKELILSRYKSIREFTQTIDMSYSTMDSILRRGVGNSSVSNIIKICKALNISADELANGKIVQNDYYTRVQNSSTEIEDIFYKAKFRLINTERLTIDGRPVDKESIRTLIDVMELGVEMVKRKNE